MEFLPQVPSNLVNIADFIAVSSDDFVVGPGARFSWTGLMDIMTVNRLDGASPTVPSNGSSWRLWAISHPQSLPASQSPRQPVAGRLVPAFEFESFTLTKAAFVELQQLVRRDLSKLWGYELALQPWITLKLGHPARLAYIDAYQVQNPNDAQLYDPAIAHRQSLALCSQLGLEGVNCVDPANVSQVLGTIYFPVTDDTIDRPGTTYPSSQSLVYTSARTTESLK